jgi:hypothetical protein
MSCLQFHRLAINTHKQAIAVYHVDLTNGLHGYWFYFFKKPSRRAVLPMQTHQRDETKDSNNGSRASVHPLQPPLRDFSMEQTNATR